MSVTIAALPDPPSAWAPLVRRIGSFYHEPAWIAGLRDSFGFRVHYLVAERAGAVVGALPLAELRGLAGKRRMVSLPFSYASGPMARCSPNTASLAAR